jgi:hypothetical protein
MNYIERNTVWGFSSRSIANQIYLRKARHEGAKEVHVVTHLITSMLALIMFPYQEIYDNQLGRLSGITLSELEAQGWPEWRFTEGSSPDLVNLIKHVRNALGHRHVIFSSDSANLAEVDIQFSDVRNKDGEFKWTATMSAADLERFVFMFAHFLKERERDNS